MSEFGSNIENREKSQEPDQEFSRSAPFEISTKQFTSERIRYNAEFKFENLLRDQILGLSDILEELDWAFKKKVINHITERNQKLGDYIANSIIPKQDMIKKPNLAFNLEETFVFQDILSRMSISDSLMPFDIKLTHQELFNQVLHTQGTESNREKFLQKVLSLINICLNSVSSISQIESYNEKIESIESIKRDVLRFLTSLESDIYATKRKEAIKDIYASINQSKQAFNQKTTENINPFQEAWPLCEIVDFKDYIIIQVMLDKDVSSDDIKVEADSKGQHVIVSSLKPKRFAKNIGLGCLIDPNNISASLGDGILKLKCNKTSIGVPL
jgi:HSP20 family molecular chaperone IbpA